MKATAFEFRVRFWIFVVLYTLGFIAPWDHWLHLDGSGPNAHVWGILAALLAKTGALGILAAFNLLLVLGILAALAGACLRTWGSAYLGYGVVHDSGMRADGVVAAGPYRYLRNPLYLGSFFNLIALCLLMPPSGAIFVVLTVGLFLMRLILGEEAFLHTKLGAPYAEYCARVPRLIPSLTPRVPAASAVPTWQHAFLGEIFLWGTAISYATFGWRYNAHLLLQCILVSLGLSLIARAVLTQERPATTDSADQ